jgi:hypothetical protein
MAAPAIIAGVGLGLTAYGMISSANAEADAAQKQRALDFEQANEIERRAGVQEENARDYGNRLIGAQKAYIGHSGLAFQGSPLLAIENSAAKLDTQIREMRSQATYQANALRQGADIRSDLADDRKTASYFQLGGTILTGVGRMPGIFDANDGTTLKTGKPMTLPAGKP